ncbi:MAG: hypothetical protein WC683_04270 [bacterium]
MSDNSKPVTSGKAAGLFVSLAECRKLQREAYVKGAVDHLDVSYPEEWLLKEALAEYPDPEVPHDRA